MKNLTFNFSYKEYSPEELPQEYAKLVEEAKNQTTKSYSPYSKFSVGAAVELANGAIIGGNNQENSAYPSGLCAERTAMFYANSQHPNTPILKLAIAAHTNGDFTDSPITPCGSCRQVILETEVRFSTPIITILYGKKRIFVIESVKNFLPLCFESKNLLG